jgi:hypothetical protein
MRDSSRSRIGCTQLALGKPVEKVRMVVESKWLMV